MVEQCTLPRTRDVDTGRSFWLAYQSVHLCMSLRPVKQTLSRMDKPCKELMIPEVFIQLPYIQTYTCMHTHRERGEGGREGEHTCTHSFSSCWEMFKFCNLQENHCWVGLISSMGFLSLTLYCVQNYLVGPDCWDHLQSSGTSKTEWACLAFWPL